jgi:glucose/arabinose dehydrogenase
MTLSRALPHFLLAALAAGFLLACSGAATEDSATGSSSGDPLVDRGLALRGVTMDLDRPWGMDFVDDDALLVTEKGGALKQVDIRSGAVVAIAGVPDSADIGQGGLLDVLVEAEGETPRVYLSYAVAIDDGYTTRVSRARLRGDRLENLEVLFTAQPAYPTKRHFGSRLLIVDGFLFATVGDRGQRDYAQSLDTHNGKVVRLLPDGRIPADNPFHDSPDALPEIWTYGHRNPQGLARHPDGTLWVSEHGPKGGDELNRLSPGNNYGWPIITYGEEYRGGKIGEGTARPGMEQPEKYYVPSIATAGMDFYQAQTYPGWKDSVLISALALTHLNRVELDAGGLGEEYRYFADGDLRFRDVQVGPDGYAYVLAGNGLYRVEPAED